MASYLNAAKLDQFGKMLKRPVIGRLGIAGEATSWQLPVLKVVLKAVATYPFPGTRLIGTGTNRQVPFFLAFHRKTPSSPGHRVARQTVSSFLTRLLADDQGASHTALFGALVTLIGTGKVTNEKTYHQNVISQQGACGNLSPGMFVRNAQRAACALERPGIVSRQAPQNCPPLVMLPIGHEDGPFHRRLSGWLSLDAYKSGSSLGFCDRGALGRCGYRPLR